MLCALLVGALTTSSFCSAEGWLSSYGISLIRTCTPFFQGWWSPASSLSSDTETRGEREASITTVCKDTSVADSGLKNENPGKLQLLMGYCKGVASSCYQKLPALSGIAAYSGATVGPLSSAMLDDIPLGDSGKKSESSGKLRTFMEDCKEFASTSYARLPVLPNVDPYIEATVSYLSPFSKAVPR